MVVFDNERPERLLKALDLWMDLTGTDPSATSVMAAGGSWEIRDMNEQIKEALYLDETLVTAFLMLDAFAASYFAQRKVSILELLASPEKAAEYNKKASAYLSLIQAPDILDIGEQFALFMRKAVRYYDADVEAVQELIADKHELAFLRRDSLRSIERLRMDQFLTGDFEPESVKPVYNKVVHQFWNVNSLLALSCGMPSGVSLNLIRDPIDYQSYFAFAIRNGGNLILLSDLPNHCHPLQKYMSRRPDRELERRIAKNWFPYDLLGIKYDLESERLYIQREEQTGLVPYQQQAFPLKPINELHPREIVWIAMMFDLIVDKFWRKRATAPALSYTAEMIKIEKPLIEAAKKASLPVPVYQGIALKPLTVDDVHIEAIDPAWLGSDGGQPNKWMEDRYATKVSEESLNLISRSDMTHYLPALTNNKDPEKAGSDKVANVDASIVSVSVCTDEKVPFWEKKGRYRLHAVDGATFGTKEQLAADRVYLARHNMAKEIQRLADQEYMERKGEIAAWYKRAVEKSKFLLSCAVVEKVWRTFDPAKIEIDGTIFRDKDAGIYKYLFSTRETKKTRSYREGLGSLNLTAGWDSRAGFGQCFFNDTIATYCVVFIPQTLEDLAAMAGCKVTDLPDVLQHWQARRDFRGNHILNRIDPMAWVLRNPWEQFNFNITLYLSVRALQKLEKNFAPPADYEIPAAKKIRLKESFA